MPTPIIAGNWKMNTTLPEAVVLAAEIRDALENILGVQKIVCPPFISLMAVKGMLDGTSTMIGAQDLHYEEKGAYTGEISAEMLKGLCQYVIIGHSERRMHFGETDDVVSRKILAANASGLRPILCVGEGLMDREAGKAEEVVTKQLRRAVEHLSSLDGVTVAYEPVWAIGTGRAASGEEADAIMGAIRHTLGELYSKSTALEIPLLYGGSVTVNNATEFVRQANIDGALVGGASLNAESFVEIARLIAQ